SPFFIPENSYGRLACRTAVGSIDSALVHLTHPLGGGASTRRHGLPSRSLASPSPLKPSRRGPSPSSPSLQGIYFQMESNSMDVVAQVTARMSGFQRESDGKRCIFHFCPFENSDLRA
ncbi:hypothetical protein PIB30_086195, partial [Stylosanthes scabra]|nr:hypothetical protein [Stylosanthes scabra]